MHFEAKVAQNPGCSMRRFLRLTSNTESRYGSYKLLRREKSNSGAREASCSSMRRVRSSTLQSIRLIVICLAFLSLFTLDDANAGTRHQNATEFPVALQPFSLDPLTSHEEATSRPTHEPRGLRAVAAAPMKVAYTVPRASAAFPFDSQQPTQG